MVGWRRRREEAETAIDGSKCRDRQSKPSVARADEGEALREEARKRLKKW